ncbi:MAG: ATP-binding protein [bacterium]
MRNIRYPLKKIISNNIIVGCGIGLGTGFWLLESVIHLLFIHNEHSLRSFFRELLLLNQYPHEFWMRSLVTLLFFGFGFYAQYIINQRRRAEHRLQEINDSLESTVRERTLELETINKNLLNEIAKREKITEELRKSKDEIKENENRLKTIINSLQTGILLIDRETFEIADINPAAKEIIGEEQSSIIGKRCFDIFIEAKEGECPIVDLNKSIDNKERSIRKSDGTILPIIKTVIPIELGGRRYLLESIIDISERKKAEQEKELLLKELIHAQKIESIGTLAAGIAHEINTPIQFIGDNTSFLEGATSNLIKLINTYKNSLATLKNQQQGAELLEMIQQVEQNLDIEYLRQEIPNALKQSQEGIERVAHIVRAMKDFSHKGNDEKAPTDINRAIQTTITISKNEWKYVADLTTDLDPIMPFVPCFEGDLKQAVLNLIVNAAHAIGDVVANKGDKGIIGVKTFQEDTFVVIEVSDTGTGIPTEIHDKIFVPFFTTKVVGKGTGQGLAIAYASIVKKHKGTITFKTELGKGTTFIIKLPLK